MSLVGKRALITGAGRGIGAACAVRLAEAGVWCACADKDDPQETVAAITADDGKAVSIACDVSSEPSVNALFAGLKSQVGRIDILVHCAGIIHEKPLLETTAEEFDQVIDVNLPWYVSGRARDHAHDARAWGAHDLHGLGSELLGPRNFLALCRVEARRAGACSLVGQGVRT